MPRRKPPEPEPQKRAYGEGSCFKRADGRWVVQFRFKGKRTRPVYFAAETEARRWHRARLVEIERGTFAEPNQVPLGEYLERWVESHCVGLEPATRVSYDHDIKRLKPLARIKLSKLKPMDVEQFLHDLIVQGRAPSTIHHTRTVLSTALRDAVRLELIPSNPASIARAPRHKKNPRLAKAWNGEQSLAFMVHTLEDRFAALWMLFLVIGCRNGEARGLKWTDFDPEASTLTIGVNLSQWGQHEGPTKSKKDRTIPLTDDLVAALRRHRSHQLEERLQAGASWIDSGRIFTLPNGRALNGAYVRKCWGELVSAAGLPEMRVHDCRHSAATWMLSQGVPVAAVSGILGHAHPGITYAIYAHVVPSDVKLALQAMAALTAPLHQLGEQKEQSGS